MTSLQRSSRHTTRTRNKLIADRAARPGISGRAVLLQFSFYIKNPSTIKSWAGRYVSMTPFIFRWKATRHAISVSERMNSSDPANEIPAPAFPMLRNRKSADKLIAMIVPEYTKNPARSFSGKCGTSLRAVAASANAKQSAAARRMRVRGAYVIKPFPVKRAL